MCITASNLGVDPENPTVGTPKWEARARLHSPLNLNQKLPQLGYRLIASKLHFKDTSCFEEDS